MRKPRRYRVLADARLQGKLCVRVTLYWICCLLSVGMLLGFAVALDGSSEAPPEWLGQFWQHFRWALLWSMLVLPMALLDCMIFSNRFAGPMLRIRRSMDSLAKGEHVEKIHLRQGDYFDDLAQDFNKIAARLAEYESKDDEQTATKEQIATEDDAYSLTGSSY